MISLPVLFEVLYQIQLICVISFIIYFSKLPLTGIVIQCNVPHCLANANMIHHQHIFAILKICEHEISCWHKIWITDGTTAILMLICPCIIDSRQHLNILKHPLADDFSIQNWTLIIQSSHFKNIPIFSIFTSVEFDVRWKINYNFNRIYSELGKLKTSQPNSNLCNKSPDDWLILSWNPLGVQHLRKNDCY